MASDLEWIRFRHRRFAPTPFEPPVHHTPPSQAGAERLAQVSDNLLSPAGWVKTLAFRRRLQRCVAVEWAHGRVPSWGAQRIRDPLAPGLGDEVSQAGAGGSDRSTS